MKILVDTCVIIDQLQKREPFWKDAHEIFTLTAQEKIEAYITAKALTDIYYVTRRAVHSDEETRAIILKLLELFHLADTTVEDCKTALFSEMCDYEDAVMTETAKRINAACIVTRNQKDYKKAGILVYSPSEFIEVMHAQ